MFASAAAAEHVQRLSLFVSVKMRGPLSTTRPLPPLSLCCLSIPSPCILQGTHVGMRKKEEKKKGHTHVHDKAKGGESKHAAHLTFATQHQKNFLAPNFPLIPGRSGGRSHKLYRNLSGCVSIFARRFPSIHPV